ncbi:MAG: 4-hydroxyphenyl-beta-ketoacyl-CoA hydrolase, partial [Actinomycetales bacterium]|nr:4-hydroxyphenyl-beta-ketoacyl-CoA hydrolase [Actinomycetales bacterium]
MAYELAIDVDALVAIDTHVHIEIDDDGINSLPQTLTDAASKYFKSGHERPSLDAIADLYRERKMAAVVFT